jgi:hypothetical protein
VAPGELIGAATENGDKVENRNWGASARRAFLIVLLSIDQNYGPHCPSVLGTFIVLMMFLVPRGHHSRELADAVFKYARCQTNKRKPIWSDKMR